AAARVTLGPGAVEHSAGEGRDQLVTTPVAFRLAPDHAAVRLVVAAAGAHGVAPLIEEVVKRPGPLSPAPTVAAALLDAVALGPVERPGALAQAVLKVSDGDPFSLVGERPSPLALAAGVASPAGRLVGLIAIDPESLFLVVSVATVRDQIPIAA